MKLALFHSREWHQAQDTEAHAIIGDAESALTPVSDVAKVAV